MTIYLIITFPCKLSASLRWKGARPRLLRLRLRERLGRRDEEPAPLQPRRRAEFENQCSYKIYLHTITSSKTGRKLVEVSGKLGFSSLSAFPSSEWQTKAALPSSATLARAEFEEQCHCSRLIA